MLSRAYVTPIFSWENQPDTSAFLLSGTNLHRPSEGSCPLMHSGQAEAVLAHNVWGKAYSVIFDLYRNFAGAQVNADSEVLRLRMFGDVVKGLLHRPVNCNFQVMAERMEILRYL